MNIDTELKDSLRESILRAARPCSKCVVGGSEPLGCKGKGTGAAAYHGVPIIVCVVSRQMQKARSCTRVHVGRIAGGEAGPDPCFIMCEEYMAQLGQRSSMWHISIRQSSRRRGNTRELRLSNNGTMSGLPRWQHPWT